MLNHVSPAVIDRMIALRRDLHQHPELSGQEARTADAVAAQLRDLGLTPRSAGGHGLIVDIPGEHPGPMVALRADMDALPIQEETGLPFASQVPGVMHACGHDGHTSMLLGGAQLLIQGPPPPVGIRLLFQPAEENASGAKALIDAGALEGVGLIFGGHIDRRYPAGELIINPGPMNASTDQFQVRITGQGGHGARPHEAIDVIVVGSHLVNALQTLVSRETDPADPAVVTIGSFRAGTAANAIAGEAVLSGTLRSLKPETRHHLREGLQRMAEATGALFRAKLEVLFDNGTPPLINTPAMTALAVRAATDVVGPDKVVGLKSTNMGGEDFAYYLGHVPGGFIRFGAGRPGETPYPAHSSRFDFDESALTVGAAWFACIAHIAGQHLADGRPLT